MDNVFCSGFLEYVYCFYDCKVKNLFFHCRCQSHCVAKITLLPQYTFFIKWPKTLIIYCTTTACILTGARKKGFWHCCSGHLAFRIGFKLHYAFLFKKKFPAIEYILELLMKNVSICVFISCVSNIWKAVSLEICQGCLGKNKTKKYLKQYSKSNLNLIK